VTVTALDSHRPVLGGSTIAAAAGIDPWCSRVELFYRLRGELPEPEGEQLEWGKRVQPLVFEALRERGIDAHETRGVELYDAATPWLVGHPDGLAQTTAIFGDPGESLVEAKLTGGYGYRKGQALPLNWQAQVQTYMRLGHVERALVAVLVAGIHLDVHEVTFDEHAANLLIERAEEFVSFLRSDTCPPPDGSPSAREALAARFPRQEPGRTYRLTGLEWDYAKELRLLRESRRALDARETLLENLIKASDPEAETFIDPFDNTYATWKGVASKRLDQTLLKAERPELAALFTRETTQRRFLIHD
jgi:predicted phage-related endonuclease